MSREEQIREWKVQASKLLRQYSFPLLVDGRQAKYCDVCNGAKRVSKTKRIYMLLIVSVPWKTKACGACDGSGYMFE